jgi:alpha-ketoglutarate-dependent taurine dioxygenase
MRWNDSPAARAAILRGYRRALRDHGYVVGTSVPDGFDHPEFFSQFGEFMPSPSGELIDDITAQAGMDDVYYGMNTRALLPHTEGYEYPGLPPRYLALWCVVPPAAGGETTLCDLAPVLAALPEHQRRLLSQSTLRWHGSQGLARLGRAGVSWHPVLEPTEDGLVLRFSLNNVEEVPETHPYRGLRASACALFQSAHVAVRHAPRGFIHWDNWRVVHSRTAFSDRQRHLRRVQIAASCLRAPSGPEGGRIGQSVAPRSG